jgi:hypothetical protein
MQIQMTPADIERAREILAARAPLFDETGELAGRVVLALAFGIAEGRAHGILQGIKQTVASNDR